MLFEERPTDGVTGWRGKLGWISPAVPSSVLIVDFHSVVPDGIELAIVTLGITAIKNEQAETALSKLNDAAARIAFAGAQHIGVGGAPLVLTKGYGFDKEIIKRVEDIARVPATTDLTAAINAFEALKLKKLVMASPLNHETDGKIKKFVEDSGFEVLHVQSLNLTYNRDIHALPRSAAYVVAKQAYMEAPQADGIYIPCGAWCPPWVVDCLEKDLGVPVIQSRQVTTWAGLKALRIKAPVRGWGRLFQTLYV